MAEEFEEYEYEGAQPGVASQAELDKGPGVASQAELDKGPEVAGLTGVEKEPEAPKDNDPYDPEPYKRDAIAGLNSQLEALRKAASEVEDETPEQKKKRERSERAQKIIGAVTDGLSSMANLYFTTQYAPSMYKKENSMQEKQNATFEKLKAEREANREKALAYALQIGDKEAERAKTIREIEEEMERRRIARENANRAADLHPFNVGLKKEQWRKESELADKAGYDAETSRLVSENKAQELADKHDLMNKKINSVPGTRSSGKGGRSTGGVAEFRGLGSDGHYHSFRNRQAAIDFERSEGTYDGSRWEYDEQTVTSKGKKNKTVTKINKAVGATAQAAQDSSKVKGENTRKLGL